MATRVSDSLPAIEQVVDAFEQMRGEGASVELAAERLRPDIGLQGAMRWLRRRRLWVKGALVLLVGVAPEILAGLEQTLRNARAALGPVCVLVRIRQIAAKQLPHALAPVGFSHLPKGQLGSGRRLQHKTGADPP